MGLDCVSHLEEDQEVIHDDWLESLDDRVDQVTVDDVFAVESAEGDDIFCQEDARVGFLLLVQQQEAEGAVILQEGALGHQLSVGLL